MAEAVISDEIEDVLSSIRRLVSEDLRPLTRPPLPSRPALALGQPVVTPRGAGGPAIQPADQPVLQPQVKAASPAPGTLLLTPALRVPPLAAMSPAAPSNPLVLGLRAPGNVVPLVPQAASPAAPQAEPAPQAKTAEAPPTSATPDLVAQLAREVDRRGALDWESETGDPAPEADSLDWASFTFARRALHDSWAAQVVASELSAPLSGHLDRAMGQSTSQGKGPEAIPEAPMIELTGDEDGPLDTRWADRAEAAALADLAAQSPVPEALPMAEGEGEVLPGPSRQEEDNIFSEQVLRELVRDLIREQLQGELGDRITRNIRKMVRAEISRTLAVRSIE